MTDYHVRVEKCSSHSIGYGQQSGTSLVNRVGTIDTVLPAVIGAIDPLKDKSTGLKRIIASVVLALVTFGLRVLSYLGVDTQFVVGQKK